jgi:pyruvate,orthophosphate dikinase
VALQQLLPIQRGDFKELLTVMAPGPVTVRLLDPPIHEFLPSERQLEDELGHLQQLRSTVEGLHDLRGAMRLMHTAADKQSSLPASLGDISVELVDAAIARKQLMLHKVRELVRLGITYPEIYTMQIQAILEALAECKQEGVDAHAEIMVPQVCTSEELLHVKAMVNGARQKVEAAYNTTLDFKLGTMIEVVRACMRAPRLAEVAEFFSFGTNDLTQASFSFSREDAENKFLPFYNELGILEDNPFEVLDVHGVGQLMRVTVDWGRQQRPDLKVGICGEQGGHPASIRFCHHIGINYVSCSAPRVPVARLAAAHASLTEASYSIE